jgi:ribosomal protein S12 methylthiotransferase
MEDIVAEAERLADGGTLELNVVSQDTIAWGRDLPGKPTLATLAAALGEVPGCAGSGSTTSTPRPSPTSWWT